MKTSIWVTCWILTFHGIPALAQEDDDWDQGRWDELDDPDGTDPRGRPMMMGSHTLPQGKFGLRLSGGLLFLSGGAHFGLHDRVDLIAEGFMPYSGFGTTWLVGGGAKVRLFNHGQFAYAFKLKAYGIFYSEASGDVEQLPEGLAVWPSFMIGMKVNEGCFYAEIGALLFAYTSGQSTTDRVFQGMPAHFGGEIYLTDWMHLFINVDLVISTHFGLFSSNLAGPFNLLEGGFIFLI